MKKLLTIVAVCIITASSALANNETLAPTQVRNSFETKFGKTTNVKWKKIGEVYVGRFSDSVSNFEIYFSENGELLASARYIPSSWLPQLISNSISTRFHGAAVAQALEFASEKNTSYYIVLSDNKNEFTVRADNSGDVEVLTKTKSK